MDNQNINRTQNEENALPMSEKERKTARKAEKRRLREERRLDRKEGRRVRTALPMNNFMPFIMMKRNDACNLFEDEIDLTVTEQYIQEKRNAGMKTYGLINVLIAAYVRTIAKVPGVNRFIRGQRIMARNNIEVVLVLKRQMKLNIGETCTKFFLKPDMTADEVYHIMDKTIVETIQTPQTAFDKTAAFFTRLPRFLLRFVVSMLHLLDYYGLLPRRLTRISPFHGSLFVTSMGSLSIPPVYHHIFNFGTLPLFLSYGKIKKKNTLNDDGTVKQKRVVPIKVVCDERICDGHHYATFFRTMRYYLSHPHMLDTPPKEVRQDIP